jgi:hypothetical protein
MRPQIVLAIVGAMLAGSAIAQNPPFPPVPPFLGGVVYQDGTITIGNCAQWTAQGKINSAAAPCGSGGGSTPSKVRVTFKASDSGADLVIDHASIGIQDSGYNTLNDPVELTFGGVSGGTVPTGGTLTSDWVILFVSQNNGTVFSDTVSGTDAGWAGWSTRTVIVPANGPRLVVIADYVSGDMGDGLVETSFAGLGLQPTYNQSHPPGSWGTAYVGGPVSLVEAQLSDGLGIIVSNGGSITIGNQINNLAGITSRLLFVDAFGNLNYENGIGGGHFDFTSSGSLQFGGGSGNVFFNAFDPNGNMISMSTFGGYITTLTGNNTLKEILAFGGDTTNFTPSYQGAIFGYNGGRWGIGAAKDTFTNFSSTFEWDQNIHWNVGNALNIVTGSTNLPTVSGCGTSASVSGTDIAGEITVGTALPTGCTLTFANAYNNPPYCAVTVQQTIASFSYTISASAITISQTATNSDHINYICFGQYGG